jgi:hypothetical protein
MVHVTVFWSTVIMLGVVDGLIGPFVYSYMYIIVSM